MKGKSKGKQHTLIVLSSSCSERFSFIIQSIEQHENNNGKSKSSALTTLKRSLTTFIQTRSPLEQLQTFRQLVRLKWNDISCSVLMEIFQLCLSLCTCALNKDFIKILCRVLDTLYAASKQIDESLLSQSIMSTLQIIRDSPKLYHISTLHKLLTCSFLTFEILNDTNSLIIWRILQLLTGMLHELTLDVSSFDTDEVVNARYPSSEQKQKTRSLLGRDIVAAFEGWIRCNCSVITLLFQSVIELQEGDTPNAKQHHYHHQDPIDGMSIIINLFHSCYALLSDGSFSTDSITKIAFLLHLSLTFVYPDTEIQRDCFQRIVTDIECAVRNPQKPDESLEQRSEEIKMNEMDDDINAQKQMDSDVEVKQEPESDAITVNVDNTNDMKHDTKLNEKEEITNTSNIAQTQDSKVEDDKESTISSDGTCPFGDRWGDWNESEEDAKEPEDASLNATADSNQVTENKETTDSTNTQIPVTTESAAIDITFKSTAHDEDTHPNMDTVAEDYDLETAIYVDWNLMHNLSKMGFVRAVVTQSNIELLRYHLLDISYDLLMTFWVQQHHQTAKLYAFDTLCGWITVNCNVLKLHNKSKWGSPIDSDAITYFNSLRSKLDGIYGLIEANWEHPNRTITFMVETMYSRYLSLVDLVSLNDGTQHNWMDHVDRAMTLSVSERGKYLRLKVLVKRVGALEIMTKYGSTPWITMLLEASVVVGGNAISLITDTLRLAKQELSTPHESQEHGSSKKIKEKLLIERWRALWMDAVCNGFIHREEAVRKSTTVDLLKYILRNDPDSYRPLIRHILKRSAIEKSLWHQATLRALIGILRSGKRNGTITNSMVCVMWCERVSVRFVVR